MRDGGETGMSFLKSMVGRKLVMAITGFSMVIFVVTHLLGNTTIYSGPDGINAYAEALHRFPHIFWVFRLILAAMFLLHIFYGTKLTIENRTAKQQGYARRSERAATFAGKYMIWTGLLIGVFVVFHLLHFKFEVINPEIGASRHLDPLGRPDVYHMVVLGLSGAFVACGYIAAVAALGLHLSHSIQSAFQTAGLTSERTLPVMVRAGVIAAVAVFLGFASFPVLVLAGVLR
jgi:succinate dehydrogenase / fumarate reductase cytochrome b subunit